MEGPERGWLETDLAQQIVERTMAVVDFNVNVMAVDGTILGSGTPSRLRTVHEGALLAVSQDRSVVIDDTSARSLRGVLPGVNLPVHFHGRPVGAVGITGDPLVVEQCGQILRVMAEMMIQQAGSSEHQRWHRREREDFLARLLSGELTEPERDPTPFRPGATVDRSNHRRF